MKRSTQSRRAGARPRRILVPVDFSDSSARALRDAAIRAAESGGSLIIIYVVPADYGWLGFGRTELRDLDRSLQRQAADRLRDREEIIFLLLGDGADRARLEVEVAKRGLSNVRLLGLRPRSEMPAWIASVDVTLVLLRDLPVFETVIPSKIFEFLAQERPVILAARGEIRRGQGGIRWMGGEASRLPGFGRGAFAGRSAARGSELPPLRRAGQGQVGVKS